MELPAHPKGGVQIGISDILQWRDCATRMQFGMRRHAEGDPPESWSPENAYGSAVHHVISRLDEGDTIEQAVQQSFQIWKQWLEPSDLSRLTEDAERYLEREMTGVRTLLNEGEISVPLFEHPDVGQVWFRARIDRLYQALDDEGRLIHLDFKSSKWAKSQDEIDEDLQIWSYNWSIVEWFIDRWPEVEHVRLEQVYDQLRYGEIPTGKSDAQRAEIKRWLIAAVTAMIADAEAKPTYNEWCPWCPLKMDCPVVQHQLTDWAVTKIAALMPREERLNKDGSVSKRPGAVTLDPEGLAEYVELLPKVKRAAKVLKAFDEEIVKTLKRMPDADLAPLGKRKAERSTRRFSVKAKQEIVDKLGLGYALMLFDLTLSDVDRFFQGDKERADSIKALAEKAPAYTVIADL